MKTIKVLGTGCASCKTTVEMIRHIATINNIEIELEKVEELQEIMAYGVMSTPAIVINDKLVHAGGIPSKDSIQTWFL